jgi:MFS family permease
VTQVSAPSPWAPLQVKAFRALWIAVLVSNIGTWMQTVGAQWLLVRQPGAATLVALVQTAATLPVVLLALPSGVLADILDRRRLLIGVQLFQVAVGVALTVLTVAGQMPPALLLVFTFALGAGAALTAPAYQALIPELVPRSQLGSAAALSSVSVNLARAVGPAVAGLLVARVGVAAVFALNTLSFLFFAVVLMTWRHALDESTAPPERFVAALWAGGRYVRHAPVVRRILLRSALFVLPASALWALLPVVASQRLGLNADGYGLLLGALGVGAVGGAFLLPHIRTHLSTNMLLLAASLAYALAMAVLVLIDNVPVVALVLLPAGMAWLAVLSTVNASMQLFLPGWVRARGLSTYQVVVFGSQAAGGLVWGLLAQRTSLVVALLVAALVLLVSAATIPVRPLMDTAGLDRSTAVYWPEPQLALVPEPDVGPVRVSITYTVPPEREGAFIEAMDDVRRSRRRTGATRWELFRQGEEPHRFLETYTVPSWQEHLRQHEGRLTGYDQEAEERAVALSDTPPVVVHLLPAVPRDAAS